MNKKKSIILITIILLLSLSNVNAENSTQNDNQMNIIEKMSNKYNNTNNLTLLSFKNNTEEKEQVENTSILNKSKPIYFAMDHVNADDQIICDRIINKLKSEGFIIASAEIGPNKMSQNTHYLYENNISNAIIFHLFNGVDPSTIRELATNGNDNRGRIVRSHNNDVVLAWFYDSVDCVNENGSGVSLVYGSETGPSLENPKQYMQDNDIIAICTSSDMGKHKEDADYTGEKTVEEFIKLFE